MKFSALFLLAAITFLSCKDNVQQQAHTEPLLIKINESTVISPSITISNYSLITNDPVRDSVEATRIIELMRKLPIALKEKDSTIFGLILSKDFTYRSADEFFSRADYINNRINGDWTVDSVKFDNLALQFFGDMAVLTYQNTANGKNNAGMAGSKSFSWTNIYIKEASNWKIGSIHEISSGNK